MVQKRDTKLEVVLSLLSGDKYLREISRELKVSHTTLARKLEELFEEGIIDYSFQGKNKVFFLKKGIRIRNFVLNAERYKLGLVIENYPKLEIIFEEILKKCKENLIILFGSYSKFDASKFSDIDIYVNTNSKKVKDLLENINSKINIKGGSFDKNSLLIKEIIKNHIIIRGEEKFYEKVYN
ncbi:ArsR family transcriptional regulator [archaeon]|nr:ArsR family transcriptional regulator [archaeon]